MKSTDEMEVIFDSVSRNEHFIRVAVAAFLTRLNPTVEEVSDVKTAVSEAVTNAIIHGYAGSIQKIRVQCRIKGSDFLVVVRDTGVGIEDVEKAMEPMYTTASAQDRSGMGFTFMEAFMDRVLVTSRVGEGTTVSMWKTIGKERTR